MKWSIFICLFFLGTTPVFASKENPSPAPISIVDQSNRKTNCFSWLQNNSDPQRTSFPTRTGFVLLRKEDIIFVEVNSDKGGVVIHYRHQGIHKKERCNLKLLVIAKKIKGYPFLKISRSAIVNVNQIERYEGTRRDATLVMSNGTKVNVSRKIAGALHDWIKDMGS